MATRRADAELGESASMPQDAVSMVNSPPAAIQWVLAGGLQPEIADETYGFRWHAATNRVLIPLDGGFLGRNVHGARPKYRLFGRPSLFRLHGELRRETVVVEDILSAIAISRAGWPAIAILGTSISPEIAAAVAKDTQAVIGWFDDDPAGNRAWTSLRKQLQLWPVTLKRVITEKDPKHVHRDELIARLEGTYD